MRNLAIKIINKINICLACNQVIRVLLYLLWVLIIYSVCKQDIIYAMEQDPNDVINKAMAQRKLDTDLIDQIQRERAMDRLHEIIRGNNQQDLQGLYEHMNAITRAVEPLIDHVDGDLPNNSFRDTIRGYESILLFVTATILGYLVIRYTGDIMTWFQDAVPVIINHALNTEYILHRALNLLTDPRTEEHMIEYLTRTHSA